VEFFKQFIKDLKKTGAIAPSSKFLARDLVEQLEADIERQNCSPLNILELGPGTGPLTKEIVKLIRHVDHLDLVEVQRNFFEIIERKFSKPNVSVHFKDILKFDAGRKYDYIFSSLPYENMSRRVNRAIWEKKLSLCAENSYICYFKYVKFKDFKCAFEEQVVNEYGQDKKFVLRNLPPAKLYTLQIDKQLKSSEKLRDMF
jgi:phospholipid N-methyltransferase